MHGKTKTSFHSEIADRHVNFHYSDADLEEKNRLERQEIVARYDLGREEGAKIDDWEDPKLEYYHKQDRWGFIQ